MDEVFLMLEKYGARFNFYSEIGINLILIAIAKQNHVLCEKILRVGITKNTIDCPNALQVLAPVIDKIFQKGRILEYKRFKKYLKYYEYEGIEKNFVHTKFWRSLTKQPLIHCVIERKDLRFCQILIKDGFYVNSRDNSGNLPVHVAAQVGDSVIMGQLIKCNATINAKNYANQGPLHLATKNGHKEVFDILMSRDIDDFRDSFGKTAKEYALEHGYYDKFYVEYFSLYS